MPASADLFVGRTEELAQLRAALDAARAGNGRLVLLSGEPGIGKTRTAAELARGAEQDGALVSWGRCHDEAGAPPYWPWTQVLRDLIVAAEDDTLRDDLGAGAPDIAEIIPELRAQFPDLGPAATPSDPASARFRLFASLVRFLLAASRRRPMVVVLDDLHWADAPSLRFLRFLAPDLGTGRLLLIATYRENELSRQHPLSDALGDLARAPHVLRLRLGGLDTEQARDLVTVVAGTTPAPWLVRSIHVQTEGNPLFLREIVRFLRDRGLLAGAADGPKAGPSETLRIPEGVREVIGQRLNLLSPACNGVLRMAAVIGREFSLETLQRACGADGGEGVLQAVDDALAARLVEEVRPNRYQFTHALVRMTLYDELRAGERRRLHRAAGEAIEAVHRHDLDAVLPELARHFQQAGDTSGRAVDYAMRAGARAEAVLAFEDAVEFFQAALEMVEQRDEPDARKHGSVLLRLGDAQRKADDFDQSRGTFRAAVELARSHGLPDLFADAVIGFELATWRKGYIGWRHEGLLEEALAMLPPVEDARRLRVLSALARNQLYIGKGTMGRATVREAVAKARALGDDILAARSLLVLLEIPPEPHEAKMRLADGQEAASLAERAGELEIAAQAHLICAGLALELGRMEECRRAATELHRLAKEMRQLVFTLFEIGFLAALALHRGDLLEAESRIREGLRLDRATRSDAGDPLAMLIFDLRREQGRLSEVAPIVGMFSPQETATLWQPGLALLHVELGQLDAARMLFDNMATDDFATLVRDGRWTASIAFLTEVCTALGDAPRAAALYRLLLPHAGHNIVPGNGSGCPGAADRYLGLLATTMGRWEHAERHFAEALALNERTGGFAPLAHTLRDLATMLLRRAAPGDAARARQLLEHSLSEARRLGLIALGKRAEAQLAQLGGPPDPDALTPREAEVLELIAMGRANADIGLVLAIGVNTVATHVRSILAKTGCANRTEAAAYALRQRAGQRA